jgi:cytochrome c oxidase assembly factor CtaG
MSMPFTIASLTGAAPPFAAAAPRIALPWSFEPWVIACLGLSAGLYAVGFVRLRRRAGARRGLSLAAAAAFAAGWLAIVAALVSPLEALGGMLFSAHMVQHELLMTVAAPLLVLGRPLAVWVWAFPPVSRTALGGFFHRAGWRGPWLVVTAPLSAWILHALALWLWHVPAWFEAALADERLHTLQHVCFLGSALLFWWSVVGIVARRHRGIALLSLFTTMVHTGALGALLTLSAVVWYPVYRASAPLWGLTVLEDQQLGGIVMWVPTGFVYLACGLWLAQRWLAEPRRALAPPSDAPGAPRP